MGSLKVLNCTICEDIRPEINGKATIIGYLGSLPYVDLWVADLIRPIDRILLLFLLDKGEGSFEFTPRILDPEGRNLVPQRQEPARIHVNPNYRTNAGILFQGLIFSLSGTHSVQVLSGDDVVYNATFEVIAGVPDASIVNGVRSTGKESVSI